jgi:hypothetical protein
MSFEFKCYVYALKHPAVYKYAWDYLDDFLILPDFMDSAAICIMLSLLVVPI